MRKTNKQSQSKRKLTPLWLQLRGKFESATGTGSPPAGKTLGIRIHINAEDADRIYAAIKKEKFLDCDWQFAQFTRLWKKVEKVPNSGSVQMTVGLSVYRRSVLVASLITESL